MLTKLANETLIKDTIVEYLKWNHEIYYFPDNSYGISTDQCTKIHTIALPKDDTFFKIYELYHEIFHGYITENNNPLIGSCSQRISNQDKYGIIGRATNVAADWFADAILFKTVDENIRLPKINYIKSILENLTEKQCLDLYPPYFPHKVKKQWSTLDRSLLFAMAVEYEISDLPVPTEIKPIVNGIAEHRPYDLTIDNMTKLSNFLIKRVAPELNLSIEPAQEYENKTWYWNVI